MLYVTFFNQLFTGVDATVLEDHHFIQENYAPAKLIFIK
jgi:hypothetical protein